ncbi:hypothetical protein T484DRAFT_1889440 [Baffinella frigidus]|nr:hypothetical protein T484DRAFT_1889440 [Cryptophyta sp. CCMP2293]
MNGNGRHSELDGGLRSKHISGELFDYSVLTNDWEGSRSQHCTGLTNLGNTCFMNSVLQCIAGTATLMNTCRENHDHGHSMLVENHSLEKDFLAIFESCVRSMHKDPGKTLKPTPFQNRMKEVIKSHRNGEQEDAHEYFVNFLDFLHNMELTAYKNIHNLSKEWLRKNRSIEATTRISQIFGGTIRSQVMCGNCKHPSNTHDHITGLELEVASGGLIESLAKFTAPEKLGMANAYLCEKCKQKTQATKRIAIWTLPNVLVLQLKRFSFVHMQTGGKISRHVAFPEVLDMREYLTDPSRGGGGNTVYDLYATLIHKGSSANSGHYFADVKGEKQWFRMDDDTVHPVSVKSVLQQAHPGL